MTPLKTSILAASLILSASAQKALKQYHLTRGNTIQGVRSIGNGGGFGEMQALWIEQQLPKLVGPCLVEGSPCGLNADESKTLSHATTKPFKIQISPECPADPIFQVSPSQATLATCTLYRIDTAGATPVVQSFSEISTWVLTAHLLSEGASFDTAFETASKVFSQYQQTHESLLISLDDGEIYAHLLQIQMGSNITPQISLEGRNHTLAVTDQLLNLLNCPNSKLELGPLDDQILGSHQALLQTDVKWSCGVEQWRGTWQLFFSIESGEIAESSLHSRLVEKSRTR